MKKCCGRPVLISGTDVVCVSAVAYVSTTRANQPSHSPTQKRPRLELGFALLAPGAERSDWAGAVLSTAPLLCAPCYYPVGSLGNL